MLVVRYSNFRFCDVPAAAHFETVFSVRLLKGVYVPVFAPDNRLTEGISYPDAVFRKKR